MCSLVFHAVGSCQQFIVLLCAGVGQQLSTLQQISSPQQSSHAGLWLWLLSAAHFCVALRRITPAHPEPGIFSECLDIRQLPPASARPAL